MAGAIIQSGTQAAPLRFIFIDDERPDEGAIVSWADQDPELSVSFNPASCRNVPNDREGNWVELLKSGMVFDIVGLRNGPAINAQSCASHVGLSADSVASGHLAVALQAGEHIASGLNTMPVLREYLAIAAKFVRSFDSVTQVQWLPSDVAIAPEFFAKSIESWIDGGPFPALGLVSFKHMATNNIQTQGLSWIIGQELVLEDELAKDPPAATRLGIRLINQLVRGGALKQSERVLAPDGTQLNIAPSENRKFIRVWVA